MRRDPFDQVCSCSHETETHECLCTRRKEPAKEACRQCQGGKHSLRQKGKPITEAEALAALAGRAGSDYY